MINTDKISRIEWEDKRRLICETNLPTHTMIFIFNTVSVNKYKSVNNHQTFHFFIDYLHGSNLAWSFSIEYENESFKVFFNTHPVP